MSSDLWYKIGLVAFNRFAGAAKCEIIKGIYYLCLTHIFSLLVVSLKDQG